MISHPHPLFPPKIPLLPFPQQKSSRMIRIILLPHPLLPSHPHPPPQFVAAKSLIPKSSKILITVYYMAETWPW